MKIHSYSKSWCGIQEFAFENRVDDKRLSWWRHQMETFSALLAYCAGNSPVTGEFPGQRPVTWTYDVFFDSRLHQHLSKQWRHRRFETPSCSLWRHFNPYYRPRGWFKITMSSRQCRDPLCGDKAIFLRPYLHNGISYTARISLYWIRTQFLANEKYSAIRYLW